MKPFIFRCLFTRLAAVMITGLPAVGYAQTSLIDPVGENFFQSAYVLPDGRTRLHYIAHEPQHGLFFVDRLPNGQITPSVMYPQMFQDVYFNISAWECHFMPLADGSTIIGINQFDCDYVPPTGLCRIDAQGVVQWAIDLRETGWQWDIQRIAQVHQFAFCILTGANTMYFNGDGEIIPHEESFFIYDTLIPFSGGYIASYETQLYRLNGDFTPADSAHLDSGVMAIYALQDTAIVASTAGGVYLLSEDLNTLKYTDAVKGAGIIASAGQAVWLVKVRGDVLFKLDLELQVTGTFAIHPDAHLRYMAANENDLLLAGNYSRPTGSCVFLHTDDADAFALQWNSDIEVSDILVEEPVYYTFETDWTGGITFHYKDVNVKVVNTGAERVDRITIRYSEPVGCWAHCGMVEMQWSFDALELAPGDSTYLTVGDFTPWCVSYFSAPGGLCLWATPADDLPEFTAANNALCVQVETIVGIDDPFAPRFTIYPNPAFDRVYIAVENNSIAGKYDVGIFDLTGRLLYRENYAQQKFDIDVSSLQPGTYMLAVSSAGSRVVQKLVIAK